jgi:hypothetical protein
VKKRFTEEQIIGFLKEADKGVPVKDLCRKHNFSEASYYLWRSKYGGMDVSDAKRLKALERLIPDQRSSAATRSPLTIMNMRSVYSRRSSPHLKQRKAPAEGPTIIYEVPMASTARLRGIDPLGKSTSKRWRYGRRVLSVHKLLEPF